MFWLFPLAHAAFILIGTRDITVNMTACAQKQGPSISADLPWILRQCSAATHLLIPGQETPGEKQTATRNIFLLSSCQDPD